MAELCSAKQNEALAAQAGKSVLEEHAQICALLLALRGQVLGSQDIKQEHFDNAVIRPFETVAQKPEHIEVMECEPVAHLINAFIEVMECEPIARLQMNANIEETEFKLQKQKIESDLEAQGRAAQRLQACFRGHRYRKHNENVLQKLQKIKNRKSCPACRPLAHQCGRCAPSATPKSPPQKKGGRQSKPQLVDLAQPHKLSHSECDGCGVEPPVELCYFPKCPFGGCPPCLRQHLRVEHDVVFAPKRPPPVFPGRELFVKEVEVKHLNQEVGPVCD